MGSAFSFLSDPMRDILYFIHSHLHLSWAFSIIVLTVIVRVLLIPLTVKQYTSMKALQKLQPKMKALQQKYKDDRQKLNEEMMKLYREHQVNPFGSCLPMLIQMPVMIALFYMLRSEPFDYDNAFFWINDIKDPDKVLVFIYIGSQLLSGKLLSTTTDKSQQMMVLLLPLAFGVMFLIYPFPAGVLIFWVVSNLWTIAQQLIVRRIIKDHDGEPGKVAAEAAGASTTPGKTGGKKHGGKTKQKKRR